MQPLKPAISYDDLAKVDIRIGEIKAVQEVPDSRKLVALQVDFGDFQRQILVGMKNERDDLQSIVGIKTTFCVNLSPRKMAGWNSEGMLFDIGYNDGLLPAFLIPERDLPNGTQAG